jgi:hypothetical protein
MAVCHTVRPVRDEPRVGGRVKDLVAVDGEAPRRPEHRARIGADPVLPDQIARPAVECLNHVPRVGQVDDAVVHERHGLVPAPFVHRPDPREREPADVLTGDLGQWAVAPPLVVAPRHQPVAGIWIAQHGIGDGHVVLHLACDRQACSRRRGRLGVRLVLRRVRVQEEGGDVGCGPGRERPGVVGRHGFLDVRREIAGPRSPAGIEAGAGERRRFVPAAAIGQVTTGALCGVGGSPHGRVSGRLLREQPGEPDGSDHANRERRREYPVHRQSLAPLGSE